MDIFSDFTTLLTLAIAVFIFLRLRSVLGKRTGHQRPPFDPEELKNNRSANDLPGNDNIVTLPKRGGRGSSTAAEAADVAAIDAIAKPGSKLNDQLKNLTASDPSFQPEEFLTGARLAYEMIVTAFADGDRKTLKNLLSREVFEGFSGAITDRESRGEEIRSTFVGIDDAAIKGAEVIGNDERLTVRFVSQIISATFDSSGEIVDGDEEQIAEVIDIWTFARDVRSKDPNWKLVATESDG
ncbi:MAG: Tim44/TimA family putative adaptor protein [Rhizobiaceae bacterium]